MATTITGSGIVTPDGTAVIQAEDDTLNTPTPMLDEGVFTQTAGAMRVHRDFAGFNQWQGADGNPWSAGYLHIKTNVTGMFRISVEGYDYGSSRCIDSHGCGYVYNGGIINSNIYDSNGSQNNQVQINRFYLMADNCIAIVLYSASWYVSQFTLSAWCQAGKSIMVESSMRGDNANFY